jgi:hypothetical protein
MQCVCCFFSCLYNTDMKVCLWDRKNNKEGDTISSIHALIRTSEADKAGGKRRMRKMRSYCGTDALNKRTRGKTYGSMFRNDTDWSYVS